MIASFVPGAVLLGAGTAHASGNFGYKLLGCIQDGTIVISSSNLTCPDGGTPTGGQYTTGNMGKLWNELDAVPHRVVLTDNTAESVTFYVAGDHHQASATDPKIGWDYISPLIRNDAESATDCPALPAMGAQTVEAGQAGGAYDTIQRSVTLSMPVTSAKPCVYDYVQRLAIGASLYTGSSLQSYVIFSGQKRIQLPVGSIQPQQLSTDIHADRNTDFSWNVTKDATTRVDFGNTCGSTLSATATVTVTWTKSAGTASGYTVTSNVTATNPAHRDIDVDPTLTVKSGTLVIDGPVDLGSHTVGASSSYTWTRITHVTDLSTLTDATNPSFNDSVTATYTDTLLGVPVPGTTSATSSLANADIGSGTVSNSSATVTDTESITGAGLTFSVAAPSSGAFTGSPAYVANDHTTGPVAWSSGTVTGSSSVTFHKTVYVAAGTVIYNGDLFDTATVTPSGSTATSTPQKDIPITAAATPQLRVEKTTTEQIASAQLFTFHLLKGSSPTGTDTTRSATVTIPALGNGPVDSGYVDADTLTASSGTPNPSASYYFHEDAQAPYPAQDSTGVTFAVANGAVNACTATKPMTNSAAPPLAQVRKVTVPTGSTSWTFELSGKKADGSTFTEDKVATAGGGYVQFSQPLEFDGGTYTITEMPTTAQAAGWDLTSVAGDFGSDASRVSTSTSTESCSFTVNLTTDASPSLFECTFTNTQRGSITIIKDAVPNDSQDFSYTTSNLTPSSFSLDDDSDPTLSNTQSFTNLAAGGTYGVTEGAEPTNWDFTSLTCVATNTVSNLSTIVKTGTTATITLGAGDAVTCTYVNTKEAHVTVVKTENGATPTHAYSFELTGGPDNIDRTRTTDNTNLGQLDFGYMKPGTYTMCELAVPAGTHSTLQDAPYNGVLNSTTGDVCVSNFVLAAGDTKTFTVDNTYPLGNARTIGYWKNWNTCSGHASWAKAAKTGNHLLDEFLPQVLATGPYPYTVTTCSDAVAILTASSSKYAEHALAAQLLAARLNVAAGAAHSALTDTTIAHAEFLLGSIPWQGSSSTKIVGSTNSLRSDFLTTMTYLDNYNNNIIV